MQLLIPVRRVPVAAVVSAGKVILTGNSSNVGHEGAFSYYYFQSGMDTSRMGMGISAA